MEEQPNWSNTWIGIGVKGGGTLFVAGMETFEGQVVNADIPCLSSEFNITSVRLGLGLGGGAGLSCLFAFNIRGSFVSYNGYPIKDWGFNFSMGEEKLGVENSLREAQFLRLAGAAARAKKFLPALKEPEMIAKMRDLGSVLWTSMEEEPVGNKPVFVTLDVPYASWGREVSVNYTEGTLYAGGQS